MGRTDYKLFETVTLTCTAEGNPDPVITWYMDGVALQGPQSVGKVYTIDRISPGDRGAYHCEATNFRGRATSNSARVLIEGLCECVFVWPAAYICIPFIRVCSLLCAF